MPLRVKPHIEPFTDASESEPTVLATSKEYRRLYRDLERYTKGQIAGRSYLIAGHRGSGKTTLVQKAIEDILRDSRGMMQRPLYVRLHGPDLLPPLRKNGASTVPEDSKATPAAEPSPDELVIVLTEMMKCLFRDVTREFSRSMRESIRLRNPYGPRLRELLEVAAQFDLEMNECPPASRLRTYWERIGLLEQGILFTRHRSVLTERYITERYTAIDPFTGFEKSYNTLAGDTGIQEILVLAHLSQAFRVISGKLEEKESQTEAGKSEQSSSLKTAYAVKNLLGPFAGLLSGGVVGAGIAARGNPVTGVLLGLLTSAVISLTFSYSSSRSRSKASTSESIFIRDRSVATLSSILPPLITRLRGIGLSPVFVVDELDKVQNLQVRIQELIQHLKYLITESSFSCFLTDRRYLTCLNRQANEVAYAKEYTYFSDRLLVLYEPAELRNFVKDSFAPMKSSQPQQAVATRTQSDKDKEDPEKIAYVVAHRARLHPIDIRRQLDRLADKTSFSIEDFPSPGYRFEILVQVAIEWLLDGEDVQTQIAGNPDSRQVVYDALYYVSRLWEDASSAEVQRVPGFCDFGEGTQEKKPGFILDEGIFSEYIESRVAEEKEAAPPSPPQSPRLFPQSMRRNLRRDTEQQPEQLNRLTGTDFDLLFLKIRELINLLCNPKDFYQLVMASTRANKPPIHILNEIPGDALLEQRGNTPNYEWLYDVSGRYLQTREVNTIVTDVRAPIARINEVTDYLDRIGPELGGLQTMADLKVIPRTPEWRVVKLAIDRLTPLVDQTSHDPYGKMIADRDCVVEFASILRDFEPNVKAIMICAGIFSSEVTVPVQLDTDSPEKRQMARLSEALLRIAEILQLSASQDDDLRKLTSVLKSQYAQAKVHQESTWPAVLGFVIAAIRTTDKSDPAPIIESAWNVCKMRFTQRFRGEASLLDPRFEDVYTALNDVGPGHELSLDLSTMPATRWTRLLRRSLKTAGRVPPWFRVAASLELGFVQLAERLAKTLPDDYVLLSQWVRDTKAHTSVQGAIRRNVLVLAVEQKSMTDEWRSSARHASLVCTLADFSELIARLKEHDISTPSNIPIDLVCVEIWHENRSGLGVLSIQRPTTAAIAMSSTSAKLLSKGTSSPMTRDVEEFLKIEGVGYFCLEPPVAPSDLPSSQAPPSIVVAPRDLDDLIDRTSDPTGRTLSK